VKWLTNPEWLDYDESNDIMTCKDDDDWWLLWRLAWWSWKLLAYMNIQENTILHLNCVNFVWSSKKWFGPLKVLPLLDQMSSEVQGTFGMSVNPFGTDEFVQFIQVFGLHRFKLHRHLVDGIVKSVWFSQVFGLLRVRFKQISLYYICHYV
jgi:hypothetical protein